jgi:hypothetical protein
MTPKTTNLDMQASAHQLAARLVRLDLDAATLEMIMAALATDLCDHVDVSDAERDD